MNDLNILVAFIAGLASFLSPCVFPLVPGFLAYLGGTSLQHTASRRETFTNTIFFVLGFSLVFSVVGVLLNTVLQDAYGLSATLSRIGGVVIIAFAFFQLGLLPIKFLERSATIKPRRFKFQYLTSLLFGAAFAVGWSPCVGAVLGSVLALAASSPGSSFALLVAYSLGLGIPFLVAGAFASNFTKVIGKVGPWLRYINTLTGLLMLVLGVLIFTNSLKLFANIGFLEGLLTP